MKTIKKTAGEILLYLYVLQREKGFADRSILEFENANKCETVLNNSKLSEGLLKITDDSAIDIYNAVIYLGESGFVSFREEKTTASDMLYNIRVSASGIDIIEGIERGKYEKNKFNITFNIKLADSVNVESLIKNEIGSLFKGSLI